jgi:phosphoenolpyruvate synthase/pyruvate phosphate dikinase
VLTAVATGRTENVAGELGPAVALNEGFQAGLPVAAGFVVVAVVVNAVFSRGSAPTRRAATTGPVAAQAEAR